MIRWVITLLCILTGRKDKTSPFKTDMCHSVLPDRSRVHSRRTVDLSPLLVVMRAHCVQSGMDKLISKHVYIQSGI